MAECRAISTIPTFQYSTVPLTAPPRLASTGDSPMHRPHCAIMLLALASCTPAAERRGTTMDKDGKVILFEDFSKGMGIYNCRASRLYVALWRRRGCQADTDGSL